MSFFYQLCQGALVTLSVSLLAFVFGLLLSIIWSFSILTRFVFLRYAIFVLTGFIRSLPEILVLFAAYFGASVLLTTVFHQPIQVNAFCAGVFALGLIFSAYAFQVWRTAFSGIKVGQSEAAYALGLSNWSVFKNILLPQAWRQALPGLSNLWLVLLKDSALVSLIGLGDLMNKAQLAAMTTQQPFQFYMIAAACFLLFTSCSQLLLRQCSKRADRSFITEKVEA